MAPTILTAMMNVEGGPGGNSDGEEVTVTGR